MRRATIALVSLAAFLCLAAAGTVYAIRAWTVDSGGGRAEGSSYKLEGSIGGAVCAPGGAKAAGTLYKLEVTGVQFVTAEAPPPSGGGGGGGGGCAP